MESIEATVRQMERERARRPPESSPRLEPAEPARAPSDLEDVDAAARQAERERARGASEKRPVDIFSFPGGAPANIPSSLTITAIPSRQEERRRERRDRERREGGGKPLAMKQGSSASPPTKRHSSSAGSSPSKPHGSSGGSKSSSPVPGKSKSSSSSSQSLSAKHPFLSVSPKHVSSPKHSSVSPKHASSPKQPSSGKPSLSTLRSPSPSHQAFSRPSGSTGKSRDKSSKEKLKSHRPRPERERTASAESKSPGRARKGSLSDVISKLNTLASADEGAAKDAPGKDGRKAEFTVKPSPEGIKLTINKTKSRSSSSSPSGSGGRTPVVKDGSERNSPSGLKPGVASGPASKKAFALPKQVDADSKMPASSLNSLQKSLSAKLLKQRPDGAGGVRVKPEKPKSDKSAAELAIHIVKSPAPAASPHQFSLVSPHSTASQHSPCVIDDELMDEALLGLGK
ncbi:mediator of RNA polymerase II transcription subunit 1-like [Pollicipes pollicipes]|uniref:mediator of RNA polymerase II transcription subunit 1-like n=1 Tax=Pollicipes pollicipes TaxID=41117 RepID=UPI001884D3C1|nr:mediator of RNA polymerase II transcription subunit 1-like [Pollicipes pollicipes]